MKKILLYLIVMPLCLNVHAQQSDAVFTSGISVEKKITRTWSASTFIQSGFNENYSELGYLLIDGGLGLRLNREWSLEGHYRYGSVRNVANSYDTRQYIYGDVQYVKGIGDFTLIARSRCMVKTYGLYISDENQYRDNKHFLRNRIQLKYDLGPYSDIFLATEQVYRLDDHNESEQFRFSGGYNYTFNVHHRIQLQYTVAQQVNKKAPDTDYITGVTYYFKF